jgi:hypothetical protein
MVLMSTTRKAVPEWSSPFEMCVLILRGVTVRTASRIALVVGTLLTVVNQGSVIAAGDASLATWLRTVANYLIPFTVASIGYLSPFRRPRRRSDTASSAVTGVGASGETGTEA